MYLLDTNIISELRRGEKADPCVKDWASGISSAHLFVSAISVFEIEMGILLKERKDSKQGAVLRSWFTSHVLPAFSDRVIPIDTAVALRCAKLHVPDPRSDRDALIGATALVHGMTLATRNIKDFKYIEGVDLVNPWNK